MAHPKRTATEQFLHRLIPAPDLRRAARECGMLRRMRKVDPVAFLLCTVFSLCGRGGQSLAGMRRDFATRTGVRVARSAFWARFTPAFESLVAWLLGRLQQRAAHNAPRLAGVLSSFRDVVAVDATVVRVHDSLRGLWKGTRKTTAAAAIKVHTRVRAVTGELLAHRITSEATADAKVFGVTWGDAGKLFLFDMGYSSASLWWRVHRVGAHFVTRLPRSYKPDIVGVNRTHRGRARKLIGHMLWDAVDGLRRRVIDVDCTFRVHVRRYRSSRGRWRQETFRVVGVWNDDASKYHFYVTDLPPARFNGATVAELYRLRWEVETFYKTAKSGLGLDELPSAKPHIVRTLVRAALIRASLAMQAKCEADKHVKLGRWIQPKLWTSVWTLAIESLLDKLLLRVSITRVPDWDFLAAMAIDDNRNRPPTRWKLGREPMTRHATHAISCA